MHETLRAGYDPILQDRRALPLSHTPGAYPQKGVLQEPLLGRSGLGLLSLIILLINPSLRSAFHWQGIRMIFRYHQNLTCQSSYRNVTSLKWILKRGGRRCAMQDLLSITVGKVQDVVQKKGSITLSHLESTINVSYNLLFL